MDKLTPIPTGGLKVPDSSFPSLAKSLIDRLHKEYATLNDVSTDLLLSLYNCFGNTFERALKQADSKPLLVFESLSGQRLWKVQTKDSSIYIFPHVNYCKCDAYKYQVLHHNAAYTCKHYLSAEINFARKIFDIEKISDKKMNELLITVYIGPRCEADRR